MLVHSLVLPSHMIRGLTDKFNHYRVKCIICTCFGTHALFLLSGAAAHTEACACRERERERERERQRERERERELNLKKHFIITVNKHNSLYISSQKVPHIHTHNTIHKHLQKNYNNINKNNNTPHKKAPLMQKKDAKNNIPSHTEHNTFLLHHFVSNDDKSFIALKKLKSIITLDLIKLAKTINTSCPEIFSTLFLLHT